MEKRQVDDLWPDDIIVPDMESPVIIVKRQASLLGNKTKNLVQAKVIPSEFPMDLKRAFSHPNKEHGLLFYDFIFTIAGYGSYNYKLFEFYFGTDKYPVYFRLHPDLGHELGSSYPEEVITANSEDELKNILMKIFKATHTKNIIKTLLAQVQ